MLKESEFEEDDDVSLMNYKSCFISNMVTAPNILLIFKMFCQSEDEKVVELKKKNINLEKKLQEKEKEIKHLKLVIRTSKVLYIIIILELQIVSKCCKSVLEVAVSYRVVDELKNLLNLNQSREDLVGSGDPLICMQ